MLIRRYVRDQMLRYFLFIFGILCNFELNAQLVQPLSSVETSYKIILADYEGVNWRCKRCGYYNYSESPDWKGDYYCLRCKTRKGDE